MSSIALDKQIHLYAVDTKAFYTDEEMEIDRGLERIRKRKREIGRILEVIEKYQAGRLTRPKAEHRLRRVPDFALPPDEELDSVAAELSAESRSLAAPLKQLKQRMVDLLNQFSGVREFRSEYLRDQNVISIFESSLSRAIGAETSKLTTDLVVVKTCYFKILRDIMMQGFTLNGERYMFLTASAGQIRTKRSVFIREAAWDQVRAKLMCGLTIERINEMGGINANKYLAYLALCNSATDVWDGFDITKTIVVDDMETDVWGDVDHIDTETYEITRKYMSVPVPHTDGAGMIRLDVSKNNFMCRLPWVKGLLAAFPFDKFVREANRRDPSVNHGIVKDIWGQEHDVLAEDIQVIFSKSQFKMYKYYADWSEYQHNFLEYGCEAGVCNVEPDTFDKAKINYQMLQTLPDLTDEELLELSAETRRRLKCVSSDRATMLQVFGATKENDRKSPFQESLYLYPELLQDEYTRDTLRDVRKSIERASWAGRLDVDGYYSFLIPDMYAFCQWLFLGDKEPSGLLANGEVHCSLFEPGQELDCLRSPHLYVEHCIRRNVAGADPEYKRWFVTDGVYTSTHDLISKVLQFD